MQASSNVAKPGARNGNLRAEIDAALREYRVAVDSAEAVRVAAGMREAFLGHLAAGEMTEVDYLSACAHGLDEIRERAGTDPKVHERTAKRAKDRLVILNKGLIKAVAKHVLGAASRNPDNLLEAEQEGAMGVMRAVDAFDPTRGLWSVCARHWIRYYVQTCAHHQTDFPRQRYQRMPPDVARQANIIRTRMGREPVHTDLTNKGQPVTLEEWRAWTEKTSVTSFDIMNSHRDGGDDNRGQGHDDLIADERTDPEIVIAGAHLKERLESMVAEMSPRNAAVARAIFVDGDSVQEVVERFHIHKQRIHEIKRSLAERLKKALAA